MQRDTYPCGCAHHGGLTCPLHRGAQDARSIFLAILLGVAAALAVVTAIVFFSGCSADWNAPHPITPEPGNPCGIYWYSCGNDRCCYYTDDCRPSGGCAFGGVQGPSWGASLPDAGRREYPQQTPDEIRRRRGY
jgi:hypothetical protein